MQRILLLSFGLINALFLGQCDPPIPPNGSNGFMAVVIDPSGTTAGKGWPMPDSSFFHQLADSLAIQGGGDLYVYNVGRPFPEPCTLHLQPILVNNNVYDTQYQQQQAANAVAAAQNLAQTNWFLKQLDSFLFHYHPQPGEDFSYILPATQSLSRTLNALSDDYDYREVLLYTDLVNHEKGKQPQKITAEQLGELVGIPNTNFYLCSYANTSDYQQLHLKVCGSYHEFTRLISKTRKPNQ